MCIGLSLHIRKVSLFRKIDFYNVFFCAILKNLYYDFDEIGYAKMSFCHKEKSPTGM